MTGAKDSYHILKLLAPQTRCRPPVASQGEDECGWKHAANEVQIFYTRQATIV